MPNNLKAYDGFQVLKSVFDVDTNCLRVCVVEGTTGGGSGFEVIITHTNDSIRLGDGVNFITSTTVGGKQALDVNLANIGDMVTNDGVGNPITSTPTNTSKRALDVVSLNELVPREFDEVQVTSKNADGCPLTVVYMSNSTTVATLTITYDVDGDFQRVVRS